MFKNFNLIIFFGFFHNFEFIESIIVSIEELFEEYLYENYEDEIEDLDIDEIKTDFIELLKLKDQKKLRIFNSIGAILFIFYSYMKADYPVVFINSAIVLINLYYILFNKK